MRALVIVRSTASMIARSATAETIIIETVKLNLNAVWRNHPANSFLVTSGAVRFLVCTMFKLHVDVICLRNIG